MREKRYLGDGVYASFDGYQVWLETTRAEENSSRFGGRLHRIALDNEVFNALISYWQDMHNPERS